MGLAAIREALAAWDGRVQLLDNDQGPGSRFVLQWPENAAQKPGFLLSEDGPRLAAVMR